MIDIWKSGKDTTKGNSYVKQAEYEVVIKQDGSTKENNIMLCKTCLTELGSKVSDEVLKL